MPDSFDLNRFVDAQAPIYGQVLAELRNGRKQSHWMWFVFPQIEGLGSSGMSRRYAIHSRDEAAAYLAHPVLGARLRECVDAVMRVDGRSADDIFGPVDAIKLRSSLTLFAHAAADDPRFRDALQKYFGGQDDPRTIARLGTA